MEIPRWNKAAPLSRKLLRDALHTFNRAHRAVKEEYASEWAHSTPDPGLSLSKLVRDLEPAVWDAHVRSANLRIPSGYLDPEAEEQAMEAVALGIIRHRIIQENHRNLSMLGRGRDVACKRPDSSTSSARVRDHNWDWASVEVRGKARRFFSLDRWPLELQSEEARGRIRRDDDVDPKMVFDAAAEDPIPGECFRPKFRRYGEDERLRHRPGPAVYPIGDTPLQKRVVRNMLQDRVAKGMYS